MDNLRSLRKSHNKTQQQMAIFLGLSQQAYATYENDKAQPPLDILQKLADYFEVSVDYLLGRTDTPNAESVTTSPTNLRSDVVIPDVLHQVGIGFSKQAEKPLTQEQINEVAKFVKFLQNDENK